MRFRVLFTEPVLVGEHMRRTTIVVDAEDVCDALVIGQDFGVIKDIVKLTEADVKLIDVR